MNAETFKMYMEIGRKFERGEALTPEEEMVNVKHPQPPRKLCSKCEADLGPRVDGEHRQIGKKLVCEDCYWDAFGAEIDKHPIGLPRGHRLIGAHAID